MQKAGCLFLLRHGLPKAAECEPESFVLKDSENGLSDKGFDEIYQVAEKLAVTKDWYKVKPIVISSPAKRAVETAKIVARSLGCDVITEKAISDRSIGSLNKLTYASLKIEQIRAHLDLRHKRDGSESMHEVFQRSVEWWVERGKIFSEGKVCVVVSHGEVIESIHRFLSGGDCSRLSDTLTQLSFSRFHQWSLISINHTIVKRLDCINSSLVAPIHFG